MALNIDYELQFFIDCKTVDYVDITNYGAPEKERNTLSVYLYIFRRFEDPADDTELSPANDDPDNDTTWNLKVGKSLDL